MLMIKNLPKFILHFPQFRFPQDLKLLGFDAKLNLKDLLHC